MNTKIDNAKIILEMMKNDFNKHPNCVYLVQCLCRKKDGHENDNVPVFQHTIDNFDKAERVLNRAAQIAEEKNARVYIAITPKDKNACLLKLAQEAINLNVNNCIGKRSLEGVLYSVIAKCGISPHARVLFDFDIPYNSDDANEIIKCFNMINMSFRKGYFGDYVITETPNGFHIIMDDYKYVCDEIIDNYLSEKAKSLILQNYATNNHKNYDDVKDMNFKQAFANIIHRESAGTLVYCNINN